MKSQRLRGYSGDTIKHVNAVGEPNSATGQALALHPGRQLLGDRFDDAVLDGIDAPDPARPNRTLGMVLLLGLAGLLGVLAFLSWLAWSGLEWDTPRRVSILLFVFATSFTCLSILSLLGVLMVWREKPAS